MGKASLTRRHRLLLPLPDSGQADDAQRIRADAVPVAGLLAPRAPSDLIRRTSQGGKGGHAVPLSAVRRGLAAPDPSRIERVNDFPPDLQRLRVLETWLQLTLKRVQQQIEQTEKEQKATAAPAPPPPPPAWVLQLGIGRDSLPIALHVGGCPSAGRRARPVPREQATRALTEGLEACSLCRPDTELGIL